MKVQHHIVYRNTSAPLAQTILPLGPKHGGCIVVACRVMLLCPVAPVAPDFPTKPVAPVIIKQHSRVTQEMIIS